VFWPARPLAAAAFPAGIKMAGTVLDEPKTSKNMLVCKNGR